MSWGRSPTSGTGAHNHRCFIPMGSALVSLSRHQVLGLRARVGGDVPCVADCNCFKRQEERQLYNREEFREVLDVPEGL